MSEMTILSKGQIFGNEQLNIFKEYGTKAAITDFAILLGGYVSEDHYASSLRKLEDRTGWYWTLTKEKYGDVNIVFHGGSILYNSVDSRIGGVRPTLMASLILDSKIQRVRNEFDILEVQYGEYPQNAVSKELSIILEQNYPNLKQTGKTYTTDSIRYVESDNRAFRGYPHVEYEYSGKRYVRVKANLNRNSTLLSNGVSVKNDKYTWVEVEPITWLVDEKTGIMVSKKIICSGVRFDKVRGGYNGKFNDTELKMFLDEYLSKEIGLASKTIEPIPEKEFETEEEIDEYIATKIAEARKRLTLLGKK